MILFEGPSLIDDEPIVVLATEDENPKTGRMLCTYILLQDRSPEVAAYDGGDASICGDCKFRASQVPTFRMEKTDYFPGFRNAGEIPRKQTRTCYVRLTSETADEAMAPDEIWHLYDKGYFGSYLDPALRYDPRDWDLSPAPSDWRYLGPLPVRIGSYGDPAAVPTRVWSELVKYTKGWTGYTHLWRPKACHYCDRIGIDDLCEFCDGTGNEWMPDPGLKRYCMASVDTPEERDEAQALGWRTFFVVPEQISIDLLDTPAMAYTADILCPATDPHPKRNTNCASCLLCNGTGGNATKSIWEVVHGKNRENHTWTKP